jgi:ADP-heptose:LPS heptosyltransferase
MEPFTYRKTWSRIKTGNPDLDTLAQFSNRLASVFMDDCLKRGRYRSEFIDLLCETATFSNNPGLTNPGAVALFKTVIEGLCDSFDDSQVETYYKIMAQILSFCRGLDSGSDLDRHLAYWGIKSSADFFERVEKIRAEKRVHDSRKPIKKIIILSRVTIGADVAITSVIIRRLAGFFPEAEIVIFGGVKLKEIFGGNSRLRLENVPYARQGGLLERLSIWSHISELIRRETSSCPLDQTILVDPDSRLSQLGAIPLINSRNYFFFNSRGFNSTHGEMSMAELTNLWLDRLTGGQDLCHPTVWIPVSVLKKTDAFRQKLIASGAKIIISLSFGVGGDQKKRIGRALEEKLILELLRQPKTVVLLDRGIDEEVNETDSLIETIAEQGYPAQVIDFDSLNTLNFNGGLIGIQSRVGEMAGLLAASDEFIGYNSVGQHLAAAQGIPSVTIFPDRHSRSFINRWSAYGPNDHQAIREDISLASNPEKVNDFVSRVLEIIQNKLE